MGLKIKSVTIVPGMFGIMCNDEGTSIRKSFVILTVLAADKNNDSIVPCVWNPEDKAFYLASTVSQFRGIGISNGPAEEPAFYVDDEEKVAKAIKLSAAAVEKAAFSAWRPG